LTTFILGVITGNGRFQWQFTVASCC